MRGSTTLGQVAKTVIAHLSGIAIERGVYAQLRKPGVNFGVCSWSCSRIGHWGAELLALEI